MEAVIFCGIQAAGKTTFYKEYFLKTHVRLSLDLLKTRHRERRFLEVCIQTQQSFVVDNTNPGKADRKKYILDAKANGFTIIGYYFQSKISDSIQRNSQRQVKENIPIAGIKGTFSRLEIPELTEGFDKLYYVEITDGKFLIKEWANEI
ncbi:AAA family ATPase [Spirosoma panaciterrae]|uniref:AAA family ATPase n=1 Tax=Spirosoma panaciterrae TaxID=496058 RepID=UPI00037DAF6B|nr:AAA family ATPase [Spirosoma panaciterrae]